MKKNYTIIGVLLVILIAGDGCHSFRHDRRDMKDWGRMNRMRMDQSLIHRRGAQGMHGMGPGMIRGIGHGMGFGMMRDMNRMPLDSLRWMPMGPGRRILESIPNVTENQKKQIEDLMKKNIDEMKKLREETASKMRDLMASHRKDVLSILTDEQKKFIEPGREGTSPASESLK
jgi:hypothetical protein